MILTVKQAVEFIENNGGKISRQTIYDWEKEVPKPSFFISGKKTKVDVSNLEWQRRVNSPTLNIKREKLSESAKKNIKKDESEIEDRPIIIPPRIPERPPSPEMLDLEEQARIAALNDTIYAAKIKEEKSKQEEIKTLELKKDLAPMYLVKHFFTFAENMIQRAYRRYGELSPELEALYLARKPEQAVKLLLREQESINKDAVMALIKAIEEEGFKL